MTAGQLIIRDTYNYHAQYCSPQEANERAMATLFMVIDSGARQVIEDWDDWGGVILRHALDHATDGRRRLPVHTRRPTMADFGV